MVIDPTTKLKKIGWHGNIDWVLYNDNYRTFVSKLFHGFFFFRDKHEDVGDWGNTNDDYLFQSRRITSSEGGMPADPRY